MKVEQARELADRLNTMALEEKDASLIAAAALLGGIAVNLARIAESLKPDAAPRDY